MALRFRCLILDHDDTAVDSTATVHHPAHLEAMRRLRPGHQPVDLRGWFLKNFHPGIMEYLERELGLSPTEQAVELAIWRTFAQRSEPSFYPGFLEALEEYRGRGGRIAVVSHSEGETILRHYRRQTGGSLEPELVFGWDPDERRRKPSPWPVHETLRRFGLAPSEALILDDLKPGVLMGRSAGVAVAGAGWAHRIPEIRRYMRRHSIACLLYTSPSPRDS